MAVVPAALSQVDSSYEGEELPSLPVGLGCVADDVLLVVRKRYRLGHPLGDRVAFVPDHAHQPGVHLCGVRNRGKRQGNMNKR